MKSSRKNPPAHFPVALLGRKMYNVKTRQAGLTGPAGFGGGTMVMASVLNNMLAVNIILVLVLVLAVRKENSAFGHAQNGTQGSL